MLEMAVTLSEPCYFYAVALCAVPGSVTLCCARISQFGSLLSVAVRLQVTAATAIQQAAVLADPPYNAALVPQVYTA